LTQLSCSVLILFCAIWSISLFNNHADGNEKGWSILKSIIGTTRLRNMNFECLFKVSL
jgi:hypothetical protein